MGDTGKFSLTQGDVNPVRVDFIHKIHKNPFVAPYLKDEFPDPIKSKTKQIATGMKGGDVHKFPTGDIDIMIRRAFDSN